MTYKKVQFIAYTLKTAPKKAQWDPIALRSGQTVLKDGVYQGLSTVAKDIKGRCALLRRALTAAYTYLDRDNEAEQPDHLKVFMVPEFFFRRGDGGYPMGKAGCEIEKLLRALKTMVKAKKWKDWLFVFGSAIAYRDQGPESSGDKSFYNVVPLVRGGPDGESRLLIGDLAGLVDVDDLGKAVEAASDFPGTQKCFQADALFTVDGISFGLDLARNHRDRGQRLQADPSLPGSLSPQVQLTSSCGLPLVKENIWIKENGLVFHVDGRMGEARQVKVSPTDPDGYETVPGKPASSAVDGKDLEVVKFLPGNEGKVVIHEPMDLPKIAKNPGSVRTFEHQTNDERYTLDTRIYYDQQGRYQQSACAIKNNRSGHVSPFFFLPFSLVCQESDYPLSMFMDLRFSPLTQSEENLLLFADLEYHSGSYKGALHAVPAKLEAQSRKSPRKKAG